MDSIETTLVEALDAMSATHSRVMSSAMFALARLMTPDQLEEAASDLILLGNQEADPVLSEFFRSNAGVLRELAARRRACTS